jgi:transcriptional regulator with AAA-type ATPase domain
MATAQASAWVSAADHQSLWSWVIARRTVTPGMLRLRRGHVNARCEPVHCGAKFAGAIVTIEGAVDHPDQVNAYAGAERGLAAAFPGQSRLARHARSQLASVGNEGVLTLIMGDPGTGKAVVAREVLSRTDQQFHEFDCADSSAEAWSNDVWSALQEPKCVLLTHLDEVVLAAMSALVSALKDRHPESRLVATAAATGTPALLSDMFDSRVVLPALNDRLEDLPAIASQILALQRSRGHEKRLSPEARRVLWSYSWPGNIAELEVVLGRAASVAPTSVVDAHCIRLPAHTTHGRQRSAMEEAERTLLQDALDRCEGNKLAAADYLGIARSTLYRKLNAVGFPQARLSTPPSQQQLKVTK